MLRLRVLPPLLLLLLLLLLPGGHPLLSARTPSRLARTRARTRVRSAPVEQGSESDGKEAAPERVRNDQEWRFFDVATIFVGGGNGGDGCVSFRREAMVAFGGPNGGNGGDGGSVIFECDEGINTLAPLRRRVHWRADSGRNGQGKSKHSPKAADLVIPVPPGTIVRQREKDGGRFCGELTHGGERLVVAGGGKGGRGNEAFKSSKFSAPKMCELGAEGGQRWLQVELKLVADVGLLGMPNAGKSTFLSRVSNAKPKIADYPFTTVTPNLGVVDLEDSTGLVVCDIPGLIEGAHSGVGLGLAFLRHVERCRVLLHLVDGSAEDPVGNFETIQRELALFSPKLAEKPQVVVLNKCDLPDVAASADRTLRQLHAAVKRSGSAHSRFLTASALTGDNCRDLVRRIGKLVGSLKAEERSAEASAVAPLRSNGESAGDDTYRFLEADGAAGGRAGAIDLEAIDRGVYPYEEEEAYLNGAGSELPKLVVTRGTNRRRGRATTPARFAVHASLSYPGQFRIVGHQIERIANTTAWDYPEAVARFQRILLDMNIGNTLAKAGAETGDLIMVGDFDFEFDSSMVRLGAGGNTRAKGYAAAGSMLEHFDELPEDAVGYGAEGVSFDEADWEDDGDEGETVVWSSGDEDGDPEPGPEVDWAALFAGDLPEDGDSGGAPAPWDRE